jgi:serine protease Do
MRAAVAIGAAALALGGCVPATSHPTGRADVIRLIVPATVQLESQRQGGVRRAGSGVVIAAEQTRAWVVTTRHFLEPDTPQTISARRSGAKERRPATIAAVSREDDVAVLEVEGLRTSPVPLKSAVALGDEVWVTGFPWGGRMTLVSGVVSQVLDKDGYGAYEGPPRMVDASVSYGVSGGGVFDATTGALVGIVEGYRTSRLALPQPEERVLTMPVPGETLLISSEAIVRFLQSAGLERLVKR